MDLRELLSELISIKSVSGEEKLIHNYIYRYVMMYSKEVFGTETFLVAYVPGAVKNRALIFNGHTDTVPVNNVSQWGHDPFGGEVEADKIFGRGASDMKSGVAVQLLLLQKSVAVWKPECDIFFTFVANEETDGQGTRDFLEWFEAKRVLYEDVAVVVGEPTGLEYFANGHKGNLFIKATTVGDTGHGSKPENIQNHSITRMERVIDLALKLGVDWKTRFFDSVLGAPTIGLTSIKAGDSSSPNLFPAICEATFDIRTTPGLHPHVLEELQKIPGAAFEILYQPSPCASTSLQHAICTAAQSVGVEGRVVGWASDLCYFNQVGIPGIIFGPGEESQLHATDEYAFLSKVERCVGLYIKIATTYAHS